MNVEQARADYRFLALLTAWWSRACRPDYCSDCRAAYLRLDAAAIELDNAVAAAHQNVRAPAWLERVAW